MGGPVIIVGGGFSGAMLAARLTERGRASVLIDRTGDFGPGVAYSTPFEGHLLNVRSGRMSAVEGRPGDFTDWLAANAPDHADPDGFAPRTLYGGYVRDRLASVEAAYPALIRRVTGEVAAVTDDGVRLADGETIPGDAVVLATGNPPPRTASGDDRVLADPWAPGALDGVGEADDLVIVGSGLTMIDVLQTLDARGWRGAATALSLRGLLPLMHGQTHDAQVNLPEAARTGPLSQRLKTARALARQTHWRSVMEGYRAVTAALWIEATTAQRSRFLRHLRPWWDVHRHRIAPEMGRMLDSLRLGLDLDAQGRVLGAHGRPDPRLWVLGPPARGAYWETIAVPDIRKRIETMAEALA